MVDGELMSLLNLWMIELNSIFNNSKTHTMTGSGNPFRWKRVYECDFLRFPDEWGIQGKLSQYFYSYLYPGLFNKIL